MATMRAAVLTATRQLEVTEVPRPEPGPDEVLVRVESNTLCGSDVHAFDGSHARVRPGMWFGHEIAGVVEAVGAPRQRVAPGQRVAVDSVLVCHACPPCLDGHTNRCLRYATTGSRGDGGMAEYVRVPVDNVFPIPGDLSIDDAALVQPLAIAHHAVHDRADVAPGDLVAIIGAGPIGLFTLQLCVALGARTVVADLNPARLEVAGELGATRTVDVGEEDLAGVVAEITGSAGAAQTFDCVGGSSTRVLASACDVTRVGGTITIVGTYESIVTLPASAFTRRELTVCACKGYPSRAYAACADMVTSGALVMPDLVSHRFDLAGSQQALERLSAGDPTIVKAAIHPWA